MEQRLKKNSKRRTVIGKRVALGLVMLGCTGWGGLRVHNYLRSPEELAGEVRQSLAIQSTQLADVMVAWDAPTDAMVVQLPGKRATQVLTQQHYANWQLVTRELKRQAATIARRNNPRYATFFFLDPTTDLPALEIQRGRVVTNRGLVSRDPVTNPAVEGDTILPASV